MPKLLGYELARPFSPSASFMIRHLQVVWFHTQKTTVFEPLKCVQKSSEEIEIGFGSSRWVATEVPWLAGSGCARSTPRVPSPEPTPRVPDTQSYDASFLHCGRRTAVRCASAAGSCRSWSWSASFGLGPPLHLSPTAKPARNRRGSYPKYRVLQSDAKGVLQGSLAGRFGRVPWRGVAC